MEWTMTKFPYNPSDLSPALLNTLRFIHDFTSQHHYPPVYTEMMHAFGVASKCTIKYRVDSLRDRGLVSYKEKSPRSIVLTEAGKLYLYRGAEYTTLSKERAKAEKRGVVATGDQYLRVKDCPICLKPLLPTKARPAICQCANPHPTARRVTIDRVQRFDLLSHTIHTESVLTLEYEATPWPPHRIPDREN